MKEIKELYLKHRCQATYDHVVKVAIVASKLAKKYQLDTKKCYLASLLHDISAIITPDQMYQIARHRQLKNDPAEEKYHFLLHQRISRIIAKEYFKIDDEKILSAIECHTTLKKQASDYDKVVFLADKLAWDQAGVPPYYDKVCQALKISLDYACYIYLKYQFDHHCFLMVHQWLDEAYQQLSRKFRLEK